MLELPAVRDPDRWLWGQAGRLKVIVARAYAMDRDELVHAGY